MSTSINVQKIKQEVASAICYFENASFLEDVNIEIRNEFRNFFISIEKEEFNTKLIKIEEKYGWLLNFYRESKRNSNINTIRKISVYFLVISIISIIVGIITWIILSQNSY